MPKAAELNLKKLIKHQLLTKLLLAAFCYNYRQVYRGKGHKLKSNVAFIIT